MPESSALPQSERINMQNTFCLFIPGALSTKANIRGIQHALEDYYPQSANSSVLSVESIISRKGIMRPKRFELMAERLVSEYESGRELLVLAYSYGAPEFVKTMAYIEINHPEFFNKDSDFLTKINLVMIAPFGFIAHTGQAGQLIKRFVRMVHTHKDIPLIAPSPLKGVGAVSLIPITGMTPGEISEALRSAYPELSQLNGASRVVELDTVQDYTEAVKLSPEEAADIAKLDVCLCTAVKNQEWMIFRSLLTQRGLLLRYHLATAHTGVHFEDVQPTDGLGTAEEMHKKVALALLGLKNSAVLLFMSLKGEPYKKIAELKAKGMKVKIIIPEFDTMVMLAEAKAFLGEAEEGESPNIVVLPRATHTSLMYQGEDLVKALRVLEL